MRRRYQRVSCRIFPPVARICVRARCQEVITGPDMGSIVSSLANRILAQAAALRPLENRRYLVGIAGVPGSGKSTLAAHLQARINALTGGAVAAAVPMDGYHLTRAQLDAMPDPEEAHMRRGAPWTFDPGSYLATLRSLRTPGAGSQACPSFDHGVGDPRPGDVQVEPHHSIILTEGNYLLIDEAPWREVRDVLDACIFLACDLEVAMRRVTRRQVANGASLEAARARVASNDLPNARLVAASSGRACWLVPSIPHAAE
ncbi:URK1 [Auxenochlorella protothecoides x Auxenochlorella symbiontica]